MNHRAAAALCSLALVLASTVAAARVAAQEQDDAPPMRLVERPLFMFNQSLYHGTYSRPRALAYDPKHDELWVADAGTGRIGIHRTDGVELFSFTSHEYLRNPGRIAVRPSGGVAVLEGKRDRVRVFNYRGDYGGELTLAGLGDEPMIGAIAYDAEGHLYVGENRTSQVFVYRPDGSLKFQFGSRGSDEGQFIGICGIQVGPDGTIYVLDQRAMAVQLFDSQGNFIRGWGRHEMGAQNVSLPSGLAVDSQGRVYVADELRQQVKVYSPEGKFLVAFGGLGGELGQLTFPTDIVIDRNDRIYVAERRTARVQVFEMVEVPAQ